MALYYLAGFSTAGTTQAMAFVLNGIAGSVTSGTYAYQTFASLMPAATPYSDFATAVQAALNAVGSGTYTVTYSTVTHAFTITRTVGGPAFTLASWTSGGNLRRALGFTADLTTTAASTVRPYFVIVPAVGARTDFSDVYEPDDIVDEAVSDGGTAYSVARQTSELWCDWSQTMETKAATLARSATASVPMTWQAFVKHCRGQRPFGVYESAVGNVLYKMRADGASFHPERVDSDYDGLWNIPFLCRDLGALP